MAGPIQEWAIIIVQRQIGSTQAQIREVDK